MDNEGFCATGPGSRAGLNILNGYPASFAKDRVDETTGFFYSDHLGRLSSLCARNGFLKVSCVDPVPLQQAKQHVRDQLDSLEGRGYAMCIRGARIRRLSARILFCA